MLDALQIPLVVVGRLLIGAMFVQSGFAKLTNIQGTTAYIASSGLPALSALAVFTGLLEFLGGLAIVLGLEARWAALLLAGFTLVASVLFHRYWTAPASERHVTQLLFIKNSAVAGGLLIIAALGSGPASLGAYWLPQ